MQRTPQDSNGNEKSGGAISDVLGLLLGPAFLVIAVIFAVGMSDADVPTASSPAVRPSMLETDPPRTPMGDPPISVVNGLEMRCNDCHGIIEPREIPKGERLQHSEIELKHGLNNNCYNCHDRENRELLVLHDDSTTGYADSTTLCAQCHGRIYRDWSRGTHGKTLGSWDPESPLYERLSCTQCHDPHAPMFNPMEPLPGPNTLRMGEPAAAHRSGLSSKRNPLLQWSGHGGGTHADHDETDGGHD